MATDKGGESVEKFVIVCVTVLHPNRHNDEVESCTDLKILSHQEAATDNEEKKRYQNARPFVVHAVPKRRD